ncbi:hypothetical protein [Aquimarina sp. 2304DJ70-9]|uniref:hypothetical protein n=1 Tax=Aquimarina penaris TaxID=3231044 RepID=UPI00346322A1
MTYNRIELKSEESEIISVKLNELLANYQIFYKRITILRCNPIHSYSNYVESSIRRALLL